MTLELIKMGCNIVDLEKENTDLSNYRYFIKDLELKNGIKKVHKENGTSGKNKTYIINKIDCIEIVSGARYGKNNKCIDMFGCWFNTQYDLGIGSYRLLELEKQLNENNYNSENKTYNKQYILDMINSISKNEYNKIVEIKNKIGE